ncbi:MAG: xanthine dehydrogenase family protein subunit M [Cytophagales bacterium]|nr:xanthine dehydrogenase family protein subunit M [Armatimonadota bacterium]
MHPFRYDRALTVQEALQSIRNGKNTAFLAGGTSQIDLMKEDVHRPDALVDIKRVPLAGILLLPDGVLRLGANASNNDVAYHPLVQKQYPGLAEAILAGASPQIRNMASMGGNLLQRTRCPYFRDTAMACNKREPGTGCSALEGINRVHAVLGASEKCIATHPSDMCVALAVLDALVQVQKPGGGRRTIRFRDFHRLPGNEPQKDSALEPGELITSVDLPAFAGRSHYLKVRERASYAFALVSVAVALEMEGDTIKTARVALGSVAHKPWLVEDAGKRLQGKKPDVALFRAVADDAFKDAKPLEHNGYKIPLGKNTLVRALMETSGLMPLQGPAGTAFASSAGGVAGDEAVA